MAAPFLAAPFAGWADINSFFDHDYPDYAVDGKIVIANGLTATSDAGASSDWFPAYWSDAMRQYVNYDGHNGYDFGISYQPVLASAGGIVRFAGWNGPSEGSGYGLMVLIDHRNGYITLYGHLSRLDVKKGDHVQMGQEIGISGTTGNSSGPHLHFSVYHNCQVTDPYGWTGDAQDPLRQFDGEQARYLWLPGADPLALNPPSDWPVFPLGVKLSKVARARIQRREQARRIPPAERLLLLSLPAIQTGSPVGPGVAMARAEAAVTQEAQTVLPYLKDLRDQGVVDAFQIIPAAAAIWIRGTAGADTLQGLPGVAAIVGAQSRDLVTAQIGLSHSVLAQTGSQRAPTLWPVGFRSSVQTWRLLSSVSVAEPLVSGFALPGQRIYVTLKRGRHVAATAEGITDPETGGFVVMLQDSSGATVATRAGDRLEFRSSGKSSSVVVPFLTTRVRSSAITGQAQPGSTLSVALSSPQRRSISTLVAAEHDGTYRIKPRVKLAPGTLSVVSEIDSGGNEVSTCGFVPGMIFAEHGSTVHGWVVGQNPYLAIARRGAPLAMQALRPQPNGSFEVDLGRQALRAGDQVTISTSRHTRRFRLPLLDATLDVGGRALKLVGPPHARLLVTLHRRESSQVQRDIRLSPAGLGQIRWPTQITSGDTATAQYKLPTGDVVETEARARAIVLTLGSSSIGGTTQPGAAVGIQVRASSGSALGGGFVRASLRTGNLNGRLLDNVGGSLALRPGVRIAVREGSGLTEERVPALPARVTADLVSGRFPSGQALDLTLIPVRGAAKSVQVQPDSAGFWHARLPSMPPGGGTTYLRVTLPSGITITRVIGQQRHPRTATAAHAVRKS